MFICCIFINAYSCSNQLIKEVIMSDKVCVSVKCSLCNKSLMDHEHFLHDKPSIKLNIQLGNVRGIIRLCSIYGCYDHESDVDLSGVDIAEFACPHCNQLLATKELCDKCGAPLVGFILDIGGKVNLCSRKGCTKHYVVFEDINNALKLFYNEYGG